MIFTQTTTVKNSALIAFVICLFCLLRADLGAVKSQGEAGAADPCGPPSGSPAPNDDFELVPQQFSVKAPQWDTNGFLLNPQWGWQTRHPIAEGAKPKLDDFPDSFDDVRCRNTCFRDCAGKNPATDSDVPPTGIAGCLMCNLVKPKPHRVHGHVNWFVATYTGTICFHNCSYPDMDYTFSLIPKGWAGLTRWNHPSKYDKNREEARKRRLAAGKPADDNEKVPRTIHAEFDSLETAVGFQSKIWNEFIDQASPCDARIDRNSPGNFYSNSCNQKAARNLIKQRRAVVMGLVGLDSEHNIYSELHPVYAIAIEMKTDPSDNTWIVFARNTGNEGACSVKNHPLEWPKYSGQLVTRLNLLIPPPENGKFGEVVRTAQTVFYGNNSTCPGISQYKHTDEKYEEENQGVLVTFDLRPCEGQVCTPLIEGEIHINWNLAGPPTPELFRKKEEDECVEPKKNPDKEPEQKTRPTSAQAARILSLLARLRAQATSTMSRCSYESDAAIPRAQAAETALVTMPLSSVRESLSMEATGGAITGRRGMLDILSSKSH